MIRNIGLCFLTIVLPLASPAQGGKDILRLVADTVKDEYGYKNARGAMIIPMGKYLICYTERFDRCAIVTSAEEGIIGIDRNEHILFHVFAVDNGPDPASEGLFRIVRDGKIGFADTAGQIVIQPQYDGGFPFHDGLAKVGSGCKTQSDGEHSWWTGGTWFTIDRKGNLVKP
jgi:hypothetical protein